MSEFDFIANNLFAIAKGIVPGHALFQKWGSNDAVGTSQVPVWQANVAFDPPDEAQLCNVVSDNVNDVDEGTGARTILIIGNNENNRLDQEVVTMNGTANVLTAKKYSYVLRSLVLSHGSASTITGITGGGGNLGTISITQQTSGKLAAQVVVGKNITEQMIAKVPDNERWVGWGASISVSKGKSVGVAFYTRPGPGGPWIETGKQNFYQTVLSFPFVIEFESGTEVVLMAESDLASTAVAGRFSFIRTGEHVNNGGP